MKLSQIRSIYQKMMQLKDAHEIPISKYKISSSDQKQSAVYICKYLVVRNKKS